MEPYFVPLSNPFYGQNCFQETLKRPTMETAATTTPPPLSHTAYAAHVYSCLAKLSRLVVLVTDYSPLIFQHLINGSKYE